MAVTCVAICNTGDARADADARCQATEESLELFRDHLLTAVVTAARTHAVQLHGLAALGANHPTIGRERHVRLVRARAGMRLTFFRYGHNNVSFNCIND